MSIKDGSRIKETTQTTGTGILTLAGAVTGFNTFLAEIGDTNLCFYWLLDANGTAWEKGIGTVGSGTLARTTVLRSSNSNAAITLSTGTHIVINAPVDGYATGDVNFQDLVLQRAEIKDYSETVTAPTIATNVLTLNLENGNVFDVSHNANITTLTISNPPASGKAGSFTLILTQDATGGRTITFPASVKWSGGTAPTLTTTLNKKNILTFFTVDAGTTWFGSQVGKDY